MKRLSRPWDSHAIPETKAFDRSDCLLSESDGPAPRGLEHSILMRSDVRGTQRHLLLHPYPRRGTATLPDRANFPVPPRNQREPRTDEEVFARKAHRRMNEVLARIQELGEALDDPMHLWPRLRDAWARAEDEADPKMAEIVRQANEMQPRLHALERRLRRVLRRQREMTSLDRVQEMDRASMLWLVRQPGRNIAERAGPSQRILATVRRENFNTLENRVLHSYARLAGDVAREWLQEHPQAKASRRYEAVANLRSVCRAVAAALVDLDVGVADPGVTPNYVLMQDRDYREVHDAWLRLLQRRLIEDDLWAWQAESWTDFAVLAIVLAIDELPEAQLVAQSPIVWKDEAVMGRWFDQDRPLAVFWLRHTGRIVEVQSRPVNPGVQQALTRAHVSLRVTDPGRSDMPRRVAVWTPHAMERLELRASVHGAAALLDEVQRLPANEILRHGLILTPSHEAPETLSRIKGRVRVQGIALDASGASLGAGLEALRNFLRSDIFRDGT